MYIFGSYAASVLWRPDESFDYRKILFDTHQDTKYCSENLNTIRKKRMSMHRSRLPYPCVL